MKREEPGYFPRRITVVAPLGEAVYHLVIQGTDEVGALAKVTSVIAKHRVNLISGGTYDAQGGQKFLFSVFADLAHADCSSDGLAAELQGLPCVLTVSVTQTEDVIYEQRLFPVMLFDDNRAVIMPGESIAFMERDLNKQLGVQGLQVIFEVGRSSGISVAALHRNMLPDAGRDTLLMTATDDMRARGWGIVSIQAEEVETKIKVSVKEPIFAGIKGAQSSWWLMGLISGFLESIYGYRTVASGRTKFNADTRVFAFELVEYHHDTRSNRELV